MSAGEPCLIMRRTKGMNFHSRTPKPRTVQNIILAICLLGLIAAIVLAYTNGTSVFKAVSAVTPPTRAAATSAGFPCALPVIKGGRAVAVVDLRGGVLNLTCSGTVPLIKPPAPKSAP